MVEDRQGLIQDFLLGGGETVFLKKFWIFSDSRTDKFSYNNFSNWRARCYLVMFMETRDIYIDRYVCLFLIRMRALVFYELNSRARKRNAFLA